MRITCHNGCKKPFLIEKFHLTRRLGGIERTYYSCPYCHYEYTVYYTDEGIRQRQHKLIRTMRALRQQTSSLDRELAEGCARRIDAEIKALMKELHERLEGGPLQANA
jgi:hypothetical protein